MRIRQRIRSALTWLAQGADALALMLTDETEPFCFPDEDAQLTGVDLTDEPDRTVAAVYEAVAQHPPGSVTLSPEALKMLAFGSPQKPAKVEPSAAADPLVGSYEWRLRQQKRGGL